ncbi:MAG: aspartate kinase [Anaerolineae bacterium]|nr:aspartate kinase [Anaerolineae bacterium]
MALITMKFGGTSVGSPEAISTVTEIVRGSLSRNDQVIVIVSAMSGVTDQLIRSAQDAAGGNKWGYLSVGQKIRDRHDEVINLLTQPGKNRDAVKAEVAALVAQHGELCQAVNVLGEVTPRILDSIIAFGERLSARVIAAILRDQGVNSRAYDAGEFIITDDQYGSANPLWKETEANIRKQLLPQIANGVTPIITGFIAQTLDGHGTTLGRGGSDYSGAIFAAASDSDELIIWTDVDGVMTTDPRLDKRARVLPYISYQEIGELAFYGAKVLHPKTVQPIIDKNTVLRVRNTFNPSFEGTLIGAESRPADTVVKAVTTVKNVSLLTVSGRGMIGVPGIAGRTFLASARAGCNILMISQASSEQSFCFVVVADCASRVKDEIESELVEEIAHQDVDAVDVLDQVAIVTVVGAGMRGTPGIAGRVFSMMGSNRINVIAIAQGSSECSISFVIDQADLQRAVSTLHDLALEAVVPVAAAN